MKAIDISLFAARSRSRRFHLCVRPAPVALVMAPGTCGWLCGADRDSGVTVLRCPLGVRSIGTVPGIGKIVL
jgi:hypothetical protein